jgi:hypothetical protein
MSEDNQQIGNNPQLSDDFRALGFVPDSDEWEMLVESNPNITIGGLVQSYLRIARSNYNANWNTIDDAVNDNTGINKRNIIRDVVEFYDGLLRTPSFSPPPSTDAMDIDTIPIDTGTNPIDTGTNPIDTDEMDIDGGKRRRKSKRRKSKRRKSKRRTRKSRRRSRRSRR